MSFGEGNLRTAVAELTAEKRELEARIDKLMALNGELCAEVNAKDARIRELESEITANHVETCLHRSLRREMEEEADDYEALLRDWSRWHSMHVFDRESAHAKGKLYDSIAERMRKFGLEA